MSKFNKWISMAAVAGVLLIGVAGCSSNTDSKTSESNATNVESSVEAETKIEAEYTYENNDYLVDVQWLEENIDDENLVIIDARGQKAYDSKHIKNAIPVAWQGLSDMTGKPGDLNWGTVGSDKENLSKLIGSLGINEEKKVVIYAAAQNGWGDDGRVMWTLAKAGLDNVRLLNGGMDYFSKNVDAQLLESEAHEPIAVNFEVKEINEEGNITIDELMKNYSDYKVLDTRAQDEYDGAQKYGEARGGHLPGAILAKYTDLFREDGRLKDKAELEKYFSEELKLNKEDKIVTYCTAGIRSGYMQIVLEMAGYENAKNYDGSYYEWAGREETEVEK